MEYFLHTFCTPRIVASNYSAGALDSGFQIQRKCLGFWPENIRKCLGCWPRKTAQGPWILLYSQIQKSPCCQNHYVAKKRKKCVKWLININPVKNNTLWYFISLLFGGLWVNCPIELTGIVPTNWKFDVATFQNVEFRSPMKVWNSII